MTLLAPDIRTNDDILSDAALAFLTALHRTFDSTRQDLLARRRDRQGAFDGGENPDFLAATQSVRDGDWQVAPAPADLNDRRVEFASPWDEASTFRVFRLVLEFDAIPYRVVDVDEAALAAALAERRPVTMIVSSGFTSRDTARLGELIERFGLRGLDGQPARPPRPADRYGVFRVVPL